MSQEKVNKYKEEKAHRKEIMAKEKRKRVLTYTATIIVCVLIVAWIIYSAIASAINKQATSQTPVNLDAVSNFLYELSTEDEVAEDGASEDDAADEGETSEDATADEGETSEDDAADEGETSEDDAQN